MEWMKFTQEELLQESQLFGGHSCHVKTLYKKGNAKVLIDDTFTPSREEEYRQNVKLLEATLELLYPKTKFSVTTR